MLCFRVSYLILIGVRKVSFDVVFFDGKIGQS